MSAIEMLREKMQSGELKYKKPSEIFRMLGLKSKAERESVLNILKEMQSAGEIVRDGHGRFVLPEDLGLVFGTIQGHERGFAFLLRGDEGDLFIPHKSLHGALHGDSVFVKIVGGDRGDEAEVFSIVRRGMTELTGTYYREHKCGFVEADERRFSESVRVVGGTERAYSGEKVLVKIVAYPEGKSPEGEVVEVLGEGGDLLTEEESIIRTKKLAEEFPQKVLAEARRVSEEPVVPDGRRDFRDDLVITVDGEDSRDFDDAVSVARKDGDFILSVHIADVTHYVRRLGALDKEAYSRGTSVYFPDRVLPMFPTEISTGICSLNEGEDRLTLSCIMRVDGKGNVVDSEIVKGCIRSKNRMTYTKIAAILDGDEQVCREYAHLVPMCNDMRELTEILSRKRSSRGSIDLDVKEAAISYKDGEISIRENERTAAHRMIEEFMILANETTAEFVAAYELPYIYRVHEKPSEEKAETFKTYLQELGLKARFQSDNVRPGEYGKILQSLEGSDLFRVVNRVMLRSMSKARYSEENCGHFGLASRCYCHFTSPIRRYPDLTVHRILKLILDGQAAEVQSFEKFVAEAAAACSVKERNADEAERDVDELYKTWYMRSKLGEEYEGIISGVTSFGIFVELENTVEGLIRIEYLPEDDYTFVEERYLLQGTEHSYKIGDRCKIVVAGSDIATRRVEFALAEEKTDENGAENRKRKEFSKKSGK